MTANSAELNDTMLPKLYVKPSTYRTIYRIATDNSMTMHTLVVMLLEQWSDRQNNIAPPKGNPGRRLDEVDKQRIRMLAQQGWTAAQVCKRFGITPPTARKYMSEQP